jgi:hypothetical protein
MQDKSGFLARQKKLGSGSVRLVGQVANLRRVGNPLLAPIKIETDPLPEIAYLGPKKTIAGRPANPV